MKESKYGYKVCFCKSDEKRYRIHLVCNRLDGAIWNLKYCQTHEVYDYRTKEIIKNAVWKIEPIKMKFESLKLWKGCPF